VIKYIIEDSMEHKLHMLRNDPKVLEKVENDFDSLDQDKEENDDEDEDVEEAKVKPAADTFAPIHVYGFLGIAVQCSSEVDLTQSFN